MVDSSDFTNKFGNFMAVRMSKSPLSIEPEGLFYAFASFAIGHGRTDVIATIDFYSKLLFRFFVV